MVLCWYMSAPHNPNSTPLNPPNAHPKIPAIKKRTVTFHTTLDSPHKHQKCKYCKA